MNTKMSKEDGKWTIEQMAHWILNGTNLMVYGASTIAIDNGEDEEKTWKRLLEALAMITATNAYSMDMVMDRGPYFQSQISDIVRQMVDKIREQNGEPPLITVRESLN